MAAPDCPGNANESADDRPETTNEDEDQARRHHAPTRERSRHRLPLLGSQAAIEGGDGKNEHALGLCHRSAELLMRSRYLALGPDVGDEDCQACRQVAQLRISASRVAC